MAKAKTTNLRKLAIALLDSEAGIEEKAYKILRDMLVIESEKNLDILGLVDATDGCFYLPIGASKNLK